MLLQVATVLAGLLHQVFFIMLPTEIGDGQILLSRSG
jgi:hypothetical protein